MEPKIRITKLRDIPQEAVMINGLPDVGLVGVIALSHIIASLKMEEVAQIDSDLFPPIAVLHKGIPHAPMRIYCHGSLLGLISEVVIPASAVYPLAESIADWVTENKVKLVVSIGGMAEPNRQDIEKPKVGAIASDEETLKKLVDKGIQVLSEGYIVGPYAMIMRKCAEIGVPAVTLLAQSFFNYPDPEAAAMAVLELKKLLDLDINVEELIARGEEIRLRARDIMRRTQEELKRMEKGHEFATPPMYV